jgi:hypothetical protein
MDPTKKDDLEALFKRLDDLTDKEFDTDLGMKDIEALSEESPDTHHISDDTNCLCPTCLREMLEHWQQLMAQMKKIQREINYILKI